MRFKEQHLVWMGRAKMGRWGQGDVNLRGKRQSNKHESAITVNLKFEIEYPFLAFCV